MAEKSNDMKKEVAGALSYVLGPITGIFFLVTNKDLFVRFHAMQSTVVFIVLFVLQWVLGITIILFPLSALIGVVGFVLWLILIYKAWQGEEWSVPILGKVSRDLLKKVK
ncbi:MAG: hypothetical protein UU51_C0024G0004 [Microgenomates group bacterium GW2011_GWC1_41_20]|uniref:DUF4870 domain-containing protein n=3 Tax=Candidatus Woeseibacteriota TaxID=1752722 RepID=A0A0G0X144_9BACT|nr:MAG: hypothetical protein UU51_C0024G0004 [Microgenomates group bacterium GW2011_GWC1_41_20]KKS18779.1 MAG: hypothetical protein UU74_C0001G0011 [Candidatus Woesebacteria bacterium GW2011_GWA1_41_7]OGM81432.1 MAG: hypothetical protein A2393_02505 [Candidatus Woesebacteria bacterium RIFOXYB1_FULL_41_13]OGM88234.1 MAG: hypothetical protein A2594_01425 [Candidatus Woesebacteria bacterium RIFOXYD1_FULL_41_28]